MKFINKLRNLTEKQRKLVIGLVVIVALLIALVTYPFWRTQPGSSGRSEFFSIAKNTFSGAKSEISNVQNEIITAQNDLPDLGDPDEVEKEILADEYPTDITKEENDFVVTVDKVLLNEELTVATLTFENNGSGTIQLDPETNFEIVDNGVSYLPKTLLSSGEVLSEPTETTLPELILKQEIAPKKKLTGVIRFDTIPAKTSFTLKLNNVLNQDSRTKWDYEFTFDVAELKAEKASQ